MSPLLLYVAQNQSQANRPSASKVFQPHSVRNNHHALLSQVQAQTCNTGPGLTHQQASSYGVQQCSTGYYGPLCSLCIANQDLHYGRTGSLECKPCRQKAAIVSACVVSILLVLSFLAFLTQLTLQENKDAVAGQDSQGRLSDLIKVGLVAPLPNDTNTLVLVWLNHTLDLTLQALNAQLTHVGVWTLGMCSSAVFVWSCKCL